MQNAEPCYSVTSERYHTDNTAVKEIREQEELETLVAAIASGNTEELDAYCSEDKVIRIHNDLRLGLTGDITLTIPDGYALDGTGHVLTVSGGNLTISGDISDLHITGKSRINRSRLEKEHKCKRTRGCKPETEAKYRSALELYTATDLSYAEICRQCGVSVGGFSRYIRIYHRHLMLKRNGIQCSPEEAGSIKISQRCGQRPKTHAKYKNAIEACDNIAYIEFNVSQIAYLFHLNPSALGNQLRTHYPEILERREKERRRLGVNDNLHRGVKPWCKEQYAAAVEHLSTTDDTIKKAADLYGLSYPGLREHLYYYKDLIRRRADKRKRAKTNKIRGELTGNGGRHEPKSRIVEKYRRAIELYRTTAMMQEEICAETGVTITGLRNHLRIWHKDLILEHRDVDCRKERMQHFGTKRYLKSTAAKYAGAIGRLKATGGPTTEVAKEFGLNPETFREYLHEHEPELAAALGMTKLANGRLVLARSAEKYDEAVRLYETTTEPLKSIARRLGLQYNSIGGYVRRNRPDAIETHNCLLEQEERRRAEEDALRREREQTESTARTLKKEAEEKERILLALKQSGGHKRNAAKLLGIGKSTLYNKLHAYGLTEKTCPEQIVPGNPDQQDTV